MPSTVCRAKNPATCRVHGTATLEDPFERALKNRVSRFAEMEAQLMYKKHMISQLQETYESKHIQPTRKVTGFGAGDVEKLEAYNASYERLPLTEDELDAIRKYTAISYEPVNRYLENPATVPDSERAKLLDRIITHLDSATSKGESSPKTVYRVLSQDTTKEFFSSEEFAEKSGFIPGSTVTFKSFTSTSLDGFYVAGRVQEEDEQTDVVLIIETDEGIPVGSTPVGNTSSFVQDREREILLPRDRTYEVTEVSRDYRYEPGDEHTTPVNPLTVRLRLVKEAAG